MRHGSKFLSSLLLLLVVMIESAHADPGVEQVGAALNELNVWLGDDDNARNWKKFLRSDELVAELAKGAAADRQVLADIYSRYAGETPGLEKRRFIAVRESLKDWLAEFPVSFSELQESVLAEKEKFRPVAPEKVSAARNELQRAMAGLEQFLAGGSADNAEAWKRYLRWDLLQAELSKEDGPIPNQLHAIAELYAANQSGLELAPFAHLRRALHEYAHAVYYSRGDQIKSEFAKQIDDLAQRLDAYAKNPTTDDAAAIGRSLGWLHHGGQIPHVVASVRRSFDRPNFLAVASRRLIASAVETDEAREKLNQPQYVSDYILKTSIRGTAYPSLSMNLVLIPSDDRATFDIRLAGSATSNNVGYRGPVTIYTTGYSSIDAAKRVYLDQQGITAAYALAQCSTSTNIYDIAANCGLIERIAWKQAGKSQGQAEAIASSHAAARIQRQVDGEVEPRLAEANESYTERFRNRLLRRDSFPRMFRFSTTENAMNVRMIHAIPGQIAASTEAPEISGEDDLSVRVHESLVINFGESLLGGVTLTDERLVEMLQEAEAEIPEELQITPDKDPWSITFTQDQPVSASFVNDEVRIAVRGRRFTRGEQEVRAIMEMSATYSLEKSGAGSKMTRKGDVVAEYVNRERQSLGEIAMKTLMRKKFEALFKPEIVSEGLVLPEQFQGAGKMQLRQLQADKAWLTLGWALGEPAEPEKVAVAQVSGE